MNLFVVAWRPEGGAAAGSLRAALEAVLRRAPFLDPRRIEEWTAPDGRAAVACVAHPPEDVGGTLYRVWEPDRMALWTGRPVLWTGDGEADGRSPLRPSFWLAPPAGWLERLDGRWAAVRYDGEESTLSVAADALGAYPLFEAETEGTRWFSNNPEAVRSLAGDRSLDPLALAGLLGGGWSLTGDPLWAGVRRLPRGVGLTLRPGGREERNEPLALPELAALPGAGWDAAAAARDLVAGLGALAAWPGRPSQVGVTGGRDSRMVLAAALRAGFPFTARTGAEPGSDDVEVARTLCARAGIGHELLGPDPHGDRESDPERAAEVLAVMAAGTATLADAAGFPLGPRPGPVPLWHTGQGGEVARSYYGVGPSGGGAGELGELLYRSFTARRPGREPPLGPMGERLVRDHLRGWAEEALEAGAAPADVPDLFYLLGRMTMWAAPSHTCVEPVHDATAVLWSRRLLPHELGPSAEERALEVFHERVLERLAPDLVDLPFAGGGGWPSRQAPLRRRAERARALAGKALDEMTRRARARRRPVRASAIGADAFAGVQALVRERVLASPDHPAWAVLDRARVEGLVSLPSEALDPMRRYHVWRLATVFLADDFAKGSPALP